MGCRPRLHHSGATAKTPQLSGGRVTSASWPPTAGATRTACPLAPSFECHILDGSQLPVRPARHTGRLTGRSALKRTPVAAASPAPSCMHPAMSCPEHMQSSQTCHPHIPAIQAGHPNPAGQLPALTPHSTAAHNSEWLAGSWWGWPTSWGSRPQGPSGPSTLAWLLPSSTWLWRAAPRAPLQVWSAPLLRLGTCCCVLRASQRRVAPWAATGCPPPARLEPAHMLVPLYVPSTLAGAQPSTCTCEADVTSSCKVSACACPAAWRRQQGLHTAHSLASQALTDLAGAVY